jgi:hypothetical protein
VSGSLESTGNSVPSGTSNDAAPNAVVAVGSDDIVVGLDQGKPQCWHNMCLWATAGEALKSLLAPCANCLLALTINPNDRRKKLLARDRMCGATMLRSTSIKVGNWV